MGKIISAQSILKQKGFQQTKFDTAGFMDAVAQFFIRNEVSASLRLLGVSFIQYPDMPDDQEFSDDDPNLDMDIHMSDKKKGWKDQYEEDEDGDLLYVKKIPFDIMKTDLDMGILGPRILVDKPFLKNAASLLRLMGGYVVEKKKSKSFYGLRYDMYAVTLL